MNSEEEASDNDFSIELNSSQALARISASNDANGVLIEGTLGKLHHASFIDGIILEIQGTKGILRLKLRRNDLDKLSPAKPTKDLSEVK